ncbi:MAG: hypothetical protein HY751_08475 [Nitrospinae bacterium]|nr:hypothetical protein [Nitrospinota bacterium]
MAVEMTGKFRAGLSSNSTAERVFRSLNTSGGVRFSEKNGPVGDTPMIGYNSQPVKAQPKGVLKQAHLGNVDAALDNVKRAIARSTSEIRETVKEQNKTQDDEAGKAAMNQLESKGGALTTSA